MNDPVGSSEQVDLGLLNPSATSFHLEWSKSVVPLEALERVLYALADRLTGTILDAGENWRIEAEPRTAAAEIASLKHALRQEATDQALRLKVAERTDPIRNLIFAAAFSRSGLVEGQDK